MNFEDVVNKSGFPLQIALENLIGRDYKSNGWRVIYAEHQWKNQDTNESGFIDLILEYSSGVISLVVECKRVLESSWIFLNSKGTVNNRRHTKAWVSRWENDRFKLFNWLDIPTDPEFPECEYSIVHGQDPKSKPMLERVASTLVSSTESFAKEQSVFMSRENYTKIYFNVIVTTAKLVIGKFDPDSISIKDGVVDSAEFEEVPFLKFRKQLNPHSLIETVPKNDFDHRNLSNAKESTVIIVNSEHFEEFLNIFDVGGLYGIM